MPLCVRLLLFANIGLPQARLRITQEGLRDKIYGYWKGQCVGNYMGFPFTGTYLENPVPVMVYSASILKERKQAG